MVETGRATALTLSAVSMAAGASLSIFFQVICMSTLDLLIHAADCFVQIAARSCLMRRGLRISSAAPPEFHPPRRPNFARRRRLCCALGPRGFRRRKNQGEGDGGGVGCGVGWGGAGQQPSPPSGPPWRRGGREGSGAGTETGGGCAGPGWRRVARRRSRPQSCCAAFNTSQYISFTHVNTSS